MSWHALKWAAEQRTGSRSSNQVLRVLADAADKDGRCFLSQETIARRAECSVSTVRRALDQLTAGGLLRRARRHTALGYRSTDLLLLAMNTKPNAGLPVKLITRNGRRLPVKLTAPTGQIDGARVNQCSNPKRERQTEQQDSSLSERATVERLPENWTLRTDWHQWAKATFDATDDAITKAALKFHAHSAAKPRSADAWFKAWQKWCMNERGFHLRTNDVGAAADKAARVREHEHLKVKAFVESGGKRWPLPFGPRPDEPGCTIPPDILAKFGFGRADPPPRNAVPRGAPPTAGGQIDGGG
jgi:hypothetical protein